MENMLSQERDEATSIPMTDLEKSGSIQRKRNHTRAPSTMKIGKRKVSCHSLALGFTPENSEMQTLETYKLTRALILLMGDVHYLGKRVLDIVDSLRLRVMRLMRPREQEINIDVFSNPEKYLVRLPIEKIVADSKVNPKFVERYKQMIKRGEKVAPVIVVKHPRFEVYAVLDGHHRYYAYLELGKKIVNCALAGDFSSVLFFMTERGYFQPKPEVREEMRRPIPFLHENIEEFLKNFLKDPKKSTP
jgi:hypothetical protein